MGLTIKKGDIFKLDESLYDAAIAYVVGGYTGINISVNRSLTHIGNSSIAYLLFSDEVNRNISSVSKRYKSRRKHFDSEEEIIRYIEDTVSFSLDEAIKVGNRIATSGIWIRGLDQKKNEQWMEETINKWLAKHPDAEVTLVDLNHK